MNGEVDPKELRAALQLVAKARDDFQRTSLKVPQLGVLYGLRGGVGGFRMGVFAVVVQHDSCAVRHDGTVAGPEWFVRVVRDKRVILTAAGTLAEVEQRFRDWREFLVELQREGFSGGGVKV